MIVSIHQVAYIPWLGYFHKIARSDVHIFLDDVVYSKNNLFNRNKIKTPQGAAWLTVPVKYKSNNLISETLIDNSSNWRQKHWRTLKANYSRTPFYKKYEKIFEEIYKKPWELLADLNITLNTIIAEQFDIKTKFFKSSDLRVALKGNERLINLCRAVKADAYLSGKGAVADETNPRHKPYLEAALFEKNNIRVEVQNFQPPIYRQAWGEFIPNLSAVDFLFNMGGEKFYENFSDSSPS